MQTIEYNQQIYRNIVGKGNNFDDRQTDTTHTHTHTTHTCKTIVVVRAANKTETT